MTASIKVAVIEIIEPIPMGIEVRMPEADADAPANVDLQILTSTPTISLMPPTPKKRQPKADFRLFTPLQSIASAPGTLRPNGKWHGRKHTSSRRALDKENLAPATASRTLKTREEQLKAYTPPAHLLGLRQGQENTSRYPISHRF